MIEYRIDVKTRAGVPVAVITDYLELGYSKRVNEPGLLTVALKGDHPAIALLQHAGQVEVWRRDPARDLDWHCDFRGLYMSQTRAFSDHELFVMSCPGAMTQLAWRYVAYPAGTINRNAFENKPAETIMRQLVKYNATASATTPDGRIRPGAITGISEGADLGRGKRVDWYCAWKNLLETLQDLAKVAGGDFDLVQTGAQAWTFQFYPGQLGTDRSGSGSDGVLFALERGNMANAVYKLDRMGEATVAIVGGQGEAQDRLVVVETGPDYHPTLNNIEKFTDGRSDASENGLRNTGRKLLEEKRAVGSLTFDVIQTPNTLYGKHYFLGDLVRARYAGIDMVRKVLAVSINFRDTGEEAIQLEMGNP